MAEVEATADVNSPKSKPVHRAADNGAGAAVDAGSASTKPRPVQRKLSAFPVSSEGGGDSGGGGSSGPAGPTASAGSSESAGQVPSTPVPAALAALMHQADRHGNQQRAHAVVVPPTAAVPPPPEPEWSLWGLLRDACCTSSASTAVDSASIRTSASSSAGGGTTGATPLPTRGRRREYAVAGERIHTSSSAAPRPPRGADGALPRSPSRAGGGGEGGGGEEPLSSPSSVLSPTSRNARSPRDGMDAYARQGTPAWGSKHPAIIHARFEETDEKSRSRRLLGMGRQSRGKWPGGGGTSSSPTSPSLAALEAQVSALYTLGKPLRLQYGPPAGGPAIPTPGNHPRFPINNVRRPASAVGEGPLLGPLLASDIGKPCLVLDLDETLVHSSFKPVPNPDFIMPVEIEGVQHNVYVLKRPGCEEFLEAVGEYWEVVLFTASLAKYADPLLDVLDGNNVIRARLFREACVLTEGAFVKDMSLLGRSPTCTIIVDNSPASYLFQPENALPCDSFIDDPNDTELWALADFLTRIAGVADVREALAQWTRGLWAGGFDLAYVAGDEAPAVVPPAVEAEGLDAPSTPAAPSVERHKGAVRDMVPEGGGREGTPKGVTVRSSSKPGGRPKSGGAV